MYIRVFCYIFCYVYCIILEPCHTCNLLVLLERGREKEFWRYQMLLSHKSANLTIQRIIRRKCNISWTHGVVGFERGNLAYGVPRLSLKGNKGFCDVLHSDAVIGVNCCFSWIASLLFLLSRGGTEGVWWPLATSQEYCRNALLSFVCRGGGMMGCVELSVFPKQFNWVSTGKTNRGAGLSSWSVHFW